MVEKWPRGAKYDATYVVLGSTVTGFENVTVCHPVAVSLWKVACASSWPSALQMLPVCVPVLAAAL